jgi:hypothetical protein
MCALGPVQRTKRAMMTEYEQKMADNLFRLRTVEAEFAEQKASFQERLSAVVAEKDDDAKDAVARIQTKLGAVDAKFRGCEEVCSLPSSCRDSPIVTVRARVD